MKNNKIKIVLFTLLLLFAVMIGMVLINSSNHKKYQQQLNLGNHFLGEMDYESAIAAFHGAIEIDSKAYEAFLGITQAYIGLEEYTSAVSSMEQVFVLTQNDFIKISLENIRNTTNTEDIKKELENAVAYLKSNDISSYPIFTNNNIGTDSANSNTVPDASTNNIVPGNVTETITPQMNENIGTSSDNIYHTGNQNTSTQSFNYTASEFTFMGYPVNEDHFSEWKSAIRRRFP